MVDKKKRNYFDLSNVEKQKNFLTAEEFPEGSYGSSIRKDEPVENKSTPGKKDSVFIVHLITRIKRFIRIFLGKWMVLTLHTMILIVMSKLHIINKIARQAASYFIYFFTLFKTK